MIDSERQREKMAEEFYNNYKRDIEMYQKSIQKFIDSGGTSPTVIERWIKKINALNQKKSTYEDMIANLSERFKSIEYNSKIISQS